MGFSRKIKYFLVHTLKYSNKEAQVLIDSGLVEINTLVIKENALIEETCEIKVKGEIVRKKTEQVYLKFHKPIGFESSLNEAVPNNLAHFFKEYSHLAIAGRLDKQSDGLLLLSNDGKWVEQICNPDFEKEKEYEVILDKEVDLSLLEAFKRGMVIGSHRTKPAVCEILQPNQVRVILTEGKNRQIRRMCWKLGYKVLRLKRIRMDNFYLEDLNPGSIRSFYPIKH